MQASGFNLQPVNQYLWEIPPQGRMKVPGRIYTSRKMIEKYLQNDESVKQVVNVAQLPGIQKYSLAMPDIHWGYGFPIGGVAATDFNEGVKGIGPKTGLKLIKKLGNIENALITYGGENPPTFDEIKEIRKIFLKPEVTDDYDIKWSLPNTEDIFKILVDKHHFSKDRVETIIKKFSNIENMMKQKTLF